MSWPWMIRFLVFWLLFSFAGFRSVWSSVTCLTRGNQAGSDCLLFTDAQREQWMDYSKHKQQKKSLHIWARRHKKTKMSYFVLSEIKTNTVHKCMCHSDVYLNLHSKLHLVFMHTEVTVSIFWTHHVKFLSTDQIAKNVCGRNMWWRRTLNVTLSSQLVFLHHTFRDISVVDITFSLLELWSHIIAIYSFNKQ